MRKQRVTQGFSATCCGHVGSWNALCGAVLFTAGLSYYLEALTSTQFEKRMNSRGTDKHHLVGKITSPTCTDDY